MGKRTLLTNLEIKKKLGEFDFETNDTTVT